MILIEWNLSPAYFSLATYRNELIKRQSCHHIETRKLICKANQLTGVSMMATLGFNELIKNQIY